VVTGDLVEFDIKPASGYSLPDLVKLLNRGFENYFFPIQFNVPALCPEEFGNVFERAGFEPKELSKWQMRLTL
jgi:hypothetical protein